MLGRPPPSRAAGRAAFSFHDRIRSSGPPCERLSDLFRSFDSTGRKGDSYLSFRPLSGTFLSPLAGTCAILSLLPKSHLPSAAAARRRFKFPSPRSPLRGFVEGVDSVSFGLPLPRTIFFPFLGPSGLFTIIFFPPTSFLERFGPQDGEQPHLSPGPDSHKSLPPPLGHRISLNTFLRANSPSQLYREKRKPFFFRRLFADLPRPEKVLPFANGPS